MTLGRSDSSGSSISTRTTSSWSSRAKTCSQAATHTPWASHRNSSTMTFMRFFSAVVVGALPGRSWTSPPRRSGALASVSEPAQTRSRSWATGGRGRWCAPASRHRTRRTPRAPARPRPRSSADQALGHGEDVLALVVVGHVRVPIPEVGERDRDDLVLRGAGQRLAAGAGEHVVEPDVAWRSTVGAHDPNLRGRLLMPWRNGLAHRFGSP